MLVTEHVRFIMPKSREYQFGAMAAVQQFVNGFQPKSMRNDHTGGKAEYKLRYCLEMPFEDLAFFVSPLTRKLQFGGPRTSVGLDLHQMPEEKLDDFTMEVDLSDARLESMRGLGKHLVQVCGLMCGVLIQALPVVRKVRIRQNNGYTWLEDPSCHDLLQVRDDEFTGVVGWRSAATYQAAAMGLAVVELDTPDYPVWLTKWANPLYRRIEIGPGECLHRGPALMDAELIERTKRVVENVLEEIIRRCRTQEAADRAAALTLMEHTPSDVINAE